MIKASLNAVYVKAKLLAMSDQARGKAFRKVLRKSAQPVVKDLQRSWARARRKSGLVTGEIADAQAAQVRYRKRTGQATLEIGTDYRRGGYAHLWHLLENGFRHYGRNATYTTMGDEVNSLKRRREVFRDSVAKSLGGFKGQTKEGRQAIARAATAAWQYRMPLADRAIGLAKSARKARRDSARLGSSRTIPGWRVSRGVALRWQVKLAQDVKTNLAAEVLRPVKGRSR